jgi:hypothetical protein
MSIREFATKEKLLYGAQGYRGILITFMKLSKPVEIIADFQGDVVRSQI